MPFGPKPQTIKPERGENYAQQRMSWSRQIGRLRSQPWFLWIMNRVSAAVFGAVMFWAGATFNQDTAARHFRVQFQQEIETNRAATITNRCLGFAILALMGGEPIPAWCIEPLKRMRSEPFKDPTS